MMITTFGRRTPRTTSTYRGRVRDGSECPTLSLERRSTSHTQRSGLVEVPSADVASGSAVAADLAWIHRADRPLNR